LVVVALIAVGLIFLFRRKKAQREMAREREEEVTAYNFNPNQDPTLPDVGLPPASTGPGAVEMTQDTGYRGWGPNKAAIGAGAGAGAVAGAFSEKLSSSPPMSSTGFGNQPPRGAPPSASARSGDPLLGSPTNRPISDETEPYSETGDIGAAGAVKRNISNASSHYSVEGHPHDEAAEVGMAIGHPHTASYYHDGGNYGPETHYNNTGNGQGGYGRGGNPQYPPPGSTGIAQNF
jgi:hypothetical protein